MPYQEVAEGSGAQSAPPATPQPTSLPAAETIERAQFRGLLYHDPSRLHGDASAIGTGLRPAPAAAVVAVPAPGESSASLTVLTRELIEAGMVVLAIEWDTEPGYPECLAILPAAVEFLSALESVDPARIGVLGVGLGADLVLRSASTDPQLRSVMALSPYLASDYIRSGFVARLRREPECSAFLAQIDAFSALRNLVKRHVKIVFAVKESSIDLKKVLPELERLGLEKEKHIITLPDSKQRELWTSSASGSLVRHWFETTL